MAGRIVGAIQLQSDGVIQAHVSMLLIDRNSRGLRLGSRLLREGLQRAGGLQLDIRTRTEGSTSGSAPTARSASASRARTSDSAASMPAKCRASDSPRAHRASGSPAGRFRFRVKATAGWVGRAAVIASCGVQRWRVVLARRPPANPVARRCGGRPRWRDTRAEEHRRTDPARELRSRRSRRSRTATGATEPGLAKTVFGRVAADTSSDGACGV
jgi:hypothetical protein